MNRLRLLALFVAALFAGLPVCAQGLPDTTVEWKSEVVVGSDGVARIVFTGTPAVSLDEVHGTLQWISCVGEACHSPEELEFDLHPSAVISPVSPEGGVSPEGRNTRGCTPENSRFPGTPTIAGGPSRRDGGVSPKDELPKGGYFQNIKRII